MDTQQVDKIHFKAWFSKTIKEQFLIRQGLVGQYITAIYYTPKVEGWGIDIKDEAVIHIPYGYLTLVVSSGETYRIDTTYQTWCGGIFGIILEKTGLDETDQSTNAPPIITCYLIINGRA